MKTLFKKRKRQKIVSTENEVQLKKSKKHYQKGQNTKYFSHKRKISQRKENTLITNSKFSIPVSNQLQIA